jgi:NAD(P)-dependent dehydrogenase (short-subunit alcohol dehydrogenase family)
MSRSVAAVFGAGGGIGAALADGLAAEGFDETIRFARRGAGAARGDGAQPPLVDLTDEASVAQAAAYAQARGEVRLVICAAGFLHDARFAPEKSLKSLDPAHMVHAFAVNAMGPALVMKHMLPLCPREGRFVFAALSARVGSIGDNQLGGWHSYRASKAALNQFVRTAAVELARTRAQAIVVALHPGTVATPLSGPFAKSGLDVRPPDVAARELLRVIAGLAPADTGGFFDHKGAPVPW